MMESCTYCGRIHERTKPCKQKKQTVNRWNRKKNDPYHKFRCSAAWNKLRAKAMERDNNTCVVCQKEDRIPWDTKLSVHHIVPLAENWELRLSLDNVITLCDTHHNFYEDKQEYRAYLRSLVEDTDCAVVAFL